MANITRAVLLVALLAIASVTALGWSTAGRETAPPSPKALEATLLAPCCWNGTLATHDSALAAELRGEIEGRAAKGETTAAIETDLVARYGDRIRAMPSTGAFTNALVIAIDLLIAALAGLALMLFRWRRATDASDATARRASSDVTSTRREHDAYDEHIDADLAEL